METTKKTSTTKAALLVLAALSMLLSGLFIATASRSDASPPPACPDGFNLTADAKNCFQNAVITSADNPNTCAEGLLTPDGSKCYIAARLIPQQGTTECPKGYSPDDSLGGMCARFEAAPQNPEGCPDGSRGVAGGCYILVAKGPAGTLTCSNGGAVAGDVCVVTGADPVPGAGSCPTAADIVQAGCYRVVNRITSAGDCDAYAAYALAGGECKALAPTLDGWTLASQCPAADGVTPALNGMVTHPSGAVKYTACTFVPPVQTGGCPNGATLDAGICKVFVGLVSNGLVCPDAGFAVVNGKCIDQGTGTIPPASCPTGSYEDSSDNCRKPVANAKGAYYCKDAAAALNGKSCVYTAPFTVEKAPNAYKCDKGDRAVIGDQVLCFLGNAADNTTTGPSCLQGVLSTDNLYCVVPRIDTAPAAVAAPVPAFTG